MKLINMLFAFTLLLFIGCGGGSNKKQTEQNNSGSQEKMKSDNVRTIDIIGVNEMKFVVKQGNKNLQVGDAVGDDGLLLLKSIKAKPGEKIHVRLTTKSKLPASAMSHNWCLLEQGSDVEAFAKAGTQAKDNDYIPPKMEDEVIAETGLASGGNTSEVTFTVPDKTGDYDYLCTFPGHYASGMKGTFIVEK